jgi:hypothetical protein
MDHIAGLDDAKKKKFLTLPGRELRPLGRPARIQSLLLFFFIFIVGGGNKVHSTLRPLNGLLCQPRVIIIMEKSVE